eukprot:354973-Chlamydomonas_euryale.AAC.2
MAWIRKTGCGTRESLPCTLGEARVDSFIRCGSLDRGDHEVGEGMREAVHCGRSRRVESTVNATVNAAMNLERQSEGRHGASCGLEASMTWGGNVGAGRGGEGERQGCAAEAPVASQ